MPPKRARDEDDMSDSPSKEARHDIGTFRNREGNIQYAHSWPSTDTLVALRTIAREDPDVPESVFLPQGLKDGDMYKGHDLIEVQDSPQDLQDFLEVLHTSLCERKSSSQPDVPRLASLLRLVTKYQVDFLQQHTLKELVKLYPIRLDHFQTMMTVTPRQDKSSRLYDDSLVLHTLEHLDIYPLVLPAVILCYAVSVDFQDLILGKVHVNPLLFRDWDSNGTKFVSDASKARVLLTHKLIGKFQAILSRDTVFPLSEHCTNPTRCTQAAIYLLRDGIIFAKDKSRIVDTGYFSDFVTHCEVDSPFSCPDLSDSGICAMCLTKFNSSRSDCQTRL
ncbi:hypothetical protein BDV98DRAFT_608436 [Pterulicium gracile]|uniref:BTB domain-containing protein n=1 Tax=Pterulicium gracile TaxID=1884261 RepID=A0A5C3Q234_9AGAR|nr:hypothetical protein BDV98DRAFT_608436 [Pterula gracilis]